MDIAAIRDQFPALSREHNGQPLIYFDGPAGSQVSQSVIDAMVGYLSNSNANCGAKFVTSQESDQILADARAACADFVGAQDSDEIIFGPNMTTLTFALSRTLAKTWQPGDEVIVSRLDHDANFTPWVLAAERAGAKIRMIDFASTDCTLDLDQYRSLLSDRTKLVAVGAASNATGTINPVREIVAAAHAVGALTFIDAVHYAPHCRIDIQNWNSDFLVCSAYKFFGPHVGILWGRRHLLEHLAPDKLRPAPNSLPGKWMTGTQNHEGIAGVRAAVDYLASLSRNAPGSSRRERLDAAFSAIQQYERDLCQRLITGLQVIASLRIWGVTTGDQLKHRVPTVSVTHPQLTPQEMSAHLTSHGIQTWAGNHYALPFTEFAGLEPHGTLRIGLLHYNTEAEVDRLLEVFQQLLKT